MKLALNMISQSSKRAPTSGVTMEREMRVRFDDKARTERSREPRDGVPVHEKFGRQSSWRAVNAAHDEAEIEVLFA